MNEQRMPPGCSQAWRRARPALCSAVPHPWPSAQSASALLFAWPCQRSRQGPARPAGFYLYPGPASHLGQGTRQRFALAPLPCLSGEARPSPRRTYPSLRLWPSAGPVPECCGQACSVQTAALRPARHSPEQSCPAGHFQPASCLLRSACRSCRSGGQPASAQ